MAAIARRGDTHSGTCSHGAMCCPHNVTGTITGGSSSVFINGMAVARIGDTVEHDCPHCGTGHITGASSKTKANSQAIARIGDTVVYPGGMGVITSASSNVSTV